MSLFFKSYIEYFQVSHFYRIKHDMYIGAVRGLPTTEIHEDIEHDDHIYTDDQFDIFHTNYCVVTHSFGHLVSVESIYYVNNITIKVLNSGTPHVLIIDDLDEMTPDIVTVCTTFQFIKFIYINAVAV